MDETNKGDSQDLYRKLNEFACEHGMEIADPTDFLNGLDELYRKPSLTQVIEEELPIIKKVDPYFFERNKLPLPERPESHLFDLYHPRYGDKGVEQVLWSAKVTFRHLRFFLVDYPEEKKELEDMIDGYRRIFGGTYLDT